MENQFGSVECGNRQDVLFDAIPNYTLGEAPEDLSSDNPTLYRCIIAKRGLRAAYEETELPMVIVDMLADLRHLCDALELDFAACDKIAYGHYMAEK